jgi:hypothetical protein
MAYQWRLVKLFRWSGRLLEKGGPKSTPLGGLAMSCRACPHPGINLPDDWADHPENM